MRRAILYIIARYYEVRSNRAMDRSTKFWLRAEKFFERAGLDQ